MTQVATVQELRQPAVSQIGTALSEDERRWIRKSLGREPNLTELEMLDIMYSEHCSYKSSRPVLKLLPTKGKSVVVGPGYDSGIVDIGGGVVIAFKIESHNHPSAIDPYNGAATGIGGIIRDVLCTNCRPIALLDSLRFGKLETGRTRWLLQQVVKGIADYGNCVGIPTVAGEVEFDENFETNCLVNVVCLGVGKRDQLVLGRMETAGDYVVLAGGSTGRDGIHGVTFASKTIDERSEEDRPSVQVGDPFTKKVLLEATLEALSTGKVRGLKDLGGGGLTCATSEMANKGGTGTALNIERVCVRESGMTPYELMLSESQERMLFVVKPDGLRSVQYILERWEVPYAILGRVDRSGDLTVKYNGNVVASLPAKLLAECPVLRRRASRPAYIDRSVAVPKPPVPQDLTATLLKLLSSPSIASKEFVYRQYDHEVGVRTVVKPGDADAAVLRIIENGKAIAVKADCVSRHCYLDPFNGHAGAVAEAARNVVAVGAQPLAIADGCNFGDPSKPEVFWQFEQAVKGMSYMLKGLGIPCVGGNVSFYNEDESTGLAVKPTSIVVMLGLIEELDSVTTMRFKQPGDSIIAVGRTYPELGGSEYYHEIHGLTGGRAPRAIPAREKASMKIVLESIRMGYCTAAHDCSKGGIATALAIMAIKGGLGLDVELRRMPATNLSKMDEILFSESHARFLVTAPTDLAASVLKIARRNRAPASVIGRVTDGDYILRDDGKIVVKSSLATMETTWREAIPRAMGAI